MKRLTSLLFISMLSFIAARSEAQFSWRQTRGPEGGAVSAVCVDSINHVWVATKAGGIYESPDSGERWMPRNDGLPTLFFRDFEAGSRGYAYGLSNSYGVFRMKRDDNPHWEPVDTTYNFPTAISDMAVDALGNLFLSTSTYGILVSHDNGDHFVAINEGIDSVDRTRNYFMRFLAVGTDGRMYALSSRKRAYISTDRGQHWTVLPKIDSIGDPVAFYSLPNGALLLGDVRGKTLLLSDSTAWKQVLKIDTSYVYNFFYSPKTGHTFCRYANGILFRSSDFGLTWETINGPIYGGEYFPSAVDKAGAIFSGLDNDGMMRSLDDGASFESINTGLIATFVVSMQVDRQNTIYANTIGRIFRSSDQGEHWQGLPLQIRGLLMSPVYAIDSSGILYANDNGWIDISYDNGQTWSKAIQALRPLDPKMLTYALASTKSETFAATNHGLFVTHDHGHNWSNVSPNNDSASYISFVIGRDGAYYLQDQTGAIFKSSDGANWGLPISRNGQLQCVLKDGRTMLRVDYERVERTTDGGENWNTLSVDTLREAQNSFLLFGVTVDDSGQLFACSDSGIYISKDLGETWSQCSEGLAGPNQGRLSGATSLCWDRSGNYYAATHGQGVFISRPPAGVARPQLANATNIACFPNPAAKVTTLQFRLESALSVTIEITDVLGRIARTTDLRGIPGEQSVALDIHDLPNGSYLCSVMHGNVQDNTWIQVAR